jgi:signal transduction histidine kinase/sugar phosphate isomerase/epimerase
MKIGYQTIVFGERIPDLDRVLEAVALAGFEGVELAQRPERLGKRGDIHSLNDLTFRLSAHGLTLIGLANGSLRERMAFCGDQIGPHYLYVDSWDDQFAPAAIKKGFTLALHVHAYMAVRSLDDAASLLDSHPALKWLPDTGHLRVVGEDIMRALRLVPNRIAAVHLKDWTPVFGRSTHRYSRGFTELGRGIVPLEHILNELYSLGFKGWLTVEQDCSRTDPFQNMFTNAMWLHERGVLPAKPRQLSPPTHVSIGRPTQRDRLTGAESAFLRGLSKAATQDIESACAAIANAFAQLVPCKLITIWMVDLAHDVLSLRTVYPETNAPYVHWLNPASCLTGVTIERHAVTEFDLTSERPADKYGRPELHYHAPETVKELGLTRLYSVPIFDTCNKNRVRLVINLFPAESNSPLAPESLRWCGCQTAPVLDAILDRGCLNALSAASFHAGLGKSAQELATDICILVRNMIQCEGVSLFLVDSTRSRLEAIGTTGIHWFVPPQNRHYGLGEGITGKVWETRRTRLFFSTLKPPDACGKSMEVIGSAAHSCLLVPLLDSQESVVGVLRCQNKRLQSIPGNASFSDDDVAVIEAVGQAMLPHIAVLVAEEHRRAAVERLAHELLRPATSIRNAAQLIQNDLRRRHISTEDLFSFDYVGDIASWSDLMVGLVRNADFFGTRSSLTVLKATRTRFMADLIAPAVRQIEVLLKSSRFSPSAITYSRLEQVPPLWVDRNAMQQVLFNLLSNSIKYAFADPRSFHIEIDGCREGGYFRIDFRDWGEGIPSGLEERIFEEGFRAPRRDGRHVVGQGFGLWIVRTILHAHKGEVKVTNRHLPTQISLYLPASLSTHPPQGAETL